LLKHPSWRLDSSVEAGGAVEHIVGKVDGAVERADDAIASGKISRKPHPSV
jgi:hypothetical protein